ncbi:MAG: peptidylprolyl isomerase [Gemmatimonadota bacterium]
MRAARVVAVGLALAACQAAQVGRRDDALLERADLQRVVEAGHARNAAALMEATADGDAAVRRRAALGLAATRARAAAEALAALLDDPAPDVRGAAAFALGQLRDPTRVPVLEQALAREDDPEVRPRLIEALGRSGGPAALRALLALDARPAETAAVTLALARLGLAGTVSEASLQRLADALTAADPGVRERAAWFFGRVGTPTLWAPLAPRLRTALDGLDADDPAAGPLMAALARLGDTSDTPRFLFWVVEGADWRSRFQAVNALTPRVDDPRVRQPLFAALDDPAPHVRVAAATALSTLAAPTDEEMGRLESWLGAEPREAATAYPLLAAFTTRGRAEVARRWLSGRPDATAADTAAAVAALVLAPGEPGFAAALEGARRGGSVAARSLEALGDRWGQDRLVEARLERLAPVLEQALAGAPAVALAAASLLSDEAFRPWIHEEVLRERARVADPVADAVVLSILREILGGLGASLEGLPTPAAPPVRAIDWDAARRWGRTPRLVLETERGRIEVELDLGAAPLTVESMATLAASGALDGSSFHRVVPGFVAQGGDVSGRQGLGGPGYRIPTEPSLQGFERGAIGMASAGPDTEGSQFFLMQGPAWHLDGDYTVFGRVVDGMDVVDRLLQGDRIVHASVEPSG